MQENVCVRVCVCVCVCVCVTSNLDLQHKRTLDNMLAHVLGGKV